MSVKVTIEKAVIEGDSLRSVATSLAAHFGAIADGTPSNSGVAIAVSWEENNDPGSAAEQPYGAQYTDENPTEGVHEDPAPEGNEG